MAMGEFGAELDRTKFEERQKLRPYALHVSKSLRDFIAERNRDDWRITFDTTARVLTGSVDALSAPSAIDMSETSIRPAARADATHLAAFVDMASQGLASYNWRRMAEPGQAPFEVGRARAMRESGDFSYRNAHIAEIDGAVSGALLGYVIADPYDMTAIDNVPDIFRPLVELEAEAAGRWYVNVLAVYPEYRGKGIGRRLLDHADEIGQGRAQGHGTHRRGTEPGRFAALPERRLCIGFAAPIYAAAGISARGRLSAAHQAAFLTRAGRPRAGGSGVLLGTRILSGREGNDDDSSKEA